ncbi:helix-turn-helix domain-containing protein [Pseudonocardia xishanensis]|uniref:Helix-turn-helix domain-containing protein n=1 Tax=Pseudonocardia xishanensis TaxID=630995 RepID=A0ABP8RDN0_9PSEU
MHYWTTEGLPTDDQFSYWREVICQAFTPLATDRTAEHREAAQNDGGLRSWVRSSLLTSTNCAEVSSRSQLITHGEAEVRRTDSDHVFVNLQISGRCIVSQGDRAAVVPAGSFAFVDTTSPYRQEYIEDPLTKEWRVVSFRLPRADLMPLISDPSAFTATPHDATSGGIASVAAGSMIATWRNVGQLDRSAADAAESALLAVLAAAAGGNTILRDSSREALDAELRASVNRYLVAHLHGGADLSAATVAKRFGVSVRKLHSLYQGTERSFAQTIMMLRVQGCAQELAAGDLRPLTQLATRWGFYDLSHLNRVFRAHFECLPSEYREASASGSLRLPE